MSLPKPSSSFVIPSLHDDLELDCRIYYPRRSEKNASSFGKSYAILAHPYAPLGGSFDDPVIALVGETLLRYGVTLGTFNFRGAHGSTGRTSWSGKPELGDYVTFYGFMLCCLSFVEARRSFNHAPSVSGTSRPLLMLGGYSYGSLIASHVPPCQEVCQLFQNVRKGSTENEIKLRAERVARDLTAYLDLHSEAPLGRGRSNLRIVDAASHSGRGVAAGGYDSEAASRRISRESSRKSFDADRVRHSIDRARQKLKSRSTNQQDCDPDTPLQDHDQLQVCMPEISYLLISPLLSPVAGFVTMFSNPIFERKKSTAESGGTASRDNQLTTQPACCIYGGKDVFTSHKKLRKWAEDLRSRSCSVFSLYEIDVAGHFWQEPGAPTRLQSSVSNWLATDQLCRSGSQVSTEPVSPG